MCECLCLCVCVRVSERERKRKRVRNKKINFQSHLSNNIRIFVIIILPISIVLEAYSTSSPVFGTCDCCTFGTQL